VGIQVAVDVNPHLQGRYTAVTGHQGVALEFLVEYVSDFVFITNPVYVEEIRGMLSRL
jgi:hypothetical protein